MMAWSVRLVIFIVSVNPVNGVLFPRHANKELAFFEFFESIDIAGSIIYLFEAHIRASQNAGARECADGHLVSPVLLPKCPKPGEFLMPCENVPLGTNCEATLDNCTFTPDDVSLGNCPALGVPPTRTVFRKEPFKDSAQHLMVAWLLFNIALVSFFFSEYVASVYSMGMLHDCVKYLEEDNGYEINPRRVLEWGVFLCCFLKVAYLPAVLTANLMPNATGLLSLSIIVIAVKVLSMMLDCYTAFCGWNPWEHDFLLPATMMKIPFLNVCLALKLTPKAATNVTDYVTPTKLGLRFVLDIPEAIVSIVDMIFFGTSWWAALNVFGSAFMVLYWLTGRIAHYLGDAVDSVAKIANKAPTPAPTQLGRLAATSC